MGENVGVRLTPAGFKKLLDAFSSFGKLSYSQLSLVSEYHDDKETMSENTIAYLLKGVDKKYQLSTINKLVNKLNLRLKKVKKSPIVLRADRDYFVAEEPTSKEPTPFLPYHSATQLLTQCSSQAILGIHNRDNPEFQKRLAEALDSARKYVYAMARTYRHSLITDAREDWLYAPLEKAVKRPVRVRLLIADCFNETSSAHLQQLDVFSQKIAETHRNAGRDTLIELHLKLETAKDFRMRVLQTALSHFMVATENVVFWEPYRPSGRGGSGFVIETAAVPSKTITASQEVSYHGLHEPLVHDFREQYNRAKQPDDIISTYYSDRPMLKRSDDHNDRYARYDKAQAVARKWKRTDPDF